MAEYIFAGTGFSNLCLTGPDPFSSNATLKDAAINDSVLTIDPGADWSMLRVDHHAVTCMTATDRRPWRSL